MLLQPAALPSLGAIHSLGISWSGDRDCSQGDTADLDCWRAIEHLLRLAKGRNALKFLPKASCSLFAV